MRLRALPILLLLMAAQCRGGDDPASWREPIEPFRVAGNVYYVGSKGLGAYLVTSPKGAFLIDGTLEDNVAMIERNIARLGIPLSSVKILLNSHAHFDHAGGLARLKRDTGARLVALAEEKPALESGIPPSETTGRSVRFPAVTVDRTIRDGDTVWLGGIGMTALLTPGHTPGCTSWITRIREAGRTLTVLFPCSLTVAGNKLVGNRGYPGIVADFERGFARLERQRADIVLPAHPQVADIIPRLERRRRGARDAFVDPGLIGRIVAYARRSFEAELAAAQPR